MSLLNGIRRIIRGGEPSVIDYEQYGQAATGTDSANPAVLRRVGPGGLMPESGNYKFQQSYDSLLDTVQQLRQSLDGQAKRQEELLNRLSTLPHAVETLPQTSKMQSDMLKVINERLGMHAEQQRKVSEVMNTLGASGKEQGARRWKPSASKSKPATKSTGNWWIHSIVFDDDRSAARGQQPRGGMSAAGARQLRHQRDADAGMDREIADTQSVADRGAFLLSTIAVIAVIVLIVALMNVAK